MSRTVEAQLSGAGLRFAIVVARFNQAVTDRLLAGALDCLRRHGAAEADLAVVRVPGAFELPLVAKTLAESGEHHGLVCLGALVRGATPHFEYLSAQVTSALGQVMLASGVPVAFGVLTCDTMEQAEERSGAKAGNKGWDAALVALEMANLVRELKREPRRSQRRG